MRDFRHVIFIAIVLLFLLQLHVMREDAAKAKEAILVEQIISSSDSCEK